MSTEFKVGDSVIWEQVLWRKPYKSTLIPAEVKKIVEKRITILVTRPNGDQLLKQVSPEHLRAAS